MKLFRIASRQFPIFDGTGARIHGARWNSPGRRVIYACGNLSCARIEILAHSGRHAPPTNHAFVEIDVPDELRFETAEERSLPPGWDSVPDRHLARPIGDRWLASAASVVLRVPSVASPADYNFLINQEHANFSRIEASAAREIAWDERLFRQ